MEEEKNAQLWQQAKARVDFRTHFTVYIIRNALLWLIWLFSGGAHSYPWPIWPTMGWGDGILFNYLGVYRPVNSVEKEYEKLKSGQPQ